MSYKILFSTEDGEPINANDYRIIITEHNKHVVERLNNGRFADYSDNYIDWEEVSDVEELLIVYKEAFLLERKRSTKKFSLLKYLK